MLSLFTLLGKISFWKNFFGENFRYLAKISSLLPDQKFQLSVLEVFN